MSAAPVLMLYQRVAVGLLMLWLSVGATVSCLMSLIVAVAAEVLPATSVTVMPACDKLLPSLKVNEAGVVTPRSEERRVGRVGGAPVPMLYQTVAAGAVTH